MGNCLVSQEKIIKVIKTDGQILEYKAPLKVHQLLTEYPGHAVSETLPVITQLQPDAEMVAGQIYYLLELQVPDEKKMLQYSNTNEVAGEKSSGVLRIKLVISKQDLEAMLRKGGVSVSDMITQLQKKQGQNSTDKLDNDDGNRNCKGWAPILQSIPEVN